MTAVPGRFTQLPAIKGHLLDYVTRFFNGQDLIQPEDFKVLLGLYVKLPSPVVPPNILDRARAQRLGVHVSHLVMADKHPLVVAPDGPPYELSARGVLDKPPTGRNRKALSVSIIKRRADLVLDNLEEMRRSAFMFGEQVTRLPRSTRQANFARNLNHVFVPQGVATHTHAAFHPQAAIRATYDERLDYYPKWRNVRPSSPRDRVIGFEQLTDTYVRMNFNDPVLKRGAVHILIVLDINTVLFQLDEQAGNLVLQLLFAPAEFNSGNVLDDIFERLDGYKVREIIFFFAVDGGENTPSLITTQQAELDLQVNPEEELVDVRCMVKSLWEVDCDAPEAGEWRDWDEWRWFTELVQLHFPSRMVEISRAGIVMLYGVDRQTLFLDDLATAASAATGPLRQRLTTLHRQALGDANLLLFPRGFPVGGDRRLVGELSGFVYVRDTTTGLMIRIPNSVFVYNFQVGSLASDVYRRTRHLIPLIKLVLVTATAVSGGAVVGFAAVGTGFRLFVKDVVLAETTERAARLALKRFELQILGLLTDGFLAIFPSTDNRAVEFVRGFLRGFAYDALNTLITKYTELVVSGPRFYRWYKLMKRIEASIQLLEDKLDELKATVDETTAQLLTSRVVQVADTSRAGMLLLIANLYFLEYEQVEGPILAISALAGQPAPSRQEWERLRRERFGEILTRYATAMQQAQAAREQGQELYDEVHRTLATVNAAVETVFIARYAGHLVPIGVISGIGRDAVRTTFGVDIVEAKVLKGVAEIVVTPWLNLGNLTAAEFERIGQLLGHLCGAIALNGALFSKDSRLGKLKRKNRLVETFISDEFGHGLLVPIVRAVLAPHIALLERYVQAARGLGATLEREIRDILLAPNEDLAPFQTSSEREVTLGKVARLILRLDEVLTEQLRRLADDPDLASNLQRMADYIKSSRIPSASDLLAGKGPDDWSGEAMSFVVLSHLHGALLEIGRAVEQIVAVVNPGSAQTVSLLQILQIIGLDVSEDAAALLLSRDLEASFLETSTAQP